jgi:hypothetical protein
MASSLDVFQDIVRVKLGSWKQKKNCLKNLQKSKETFHTIEQKMVTGTQLSGDESFLYENNSGEDDAKVSYLQGEIKKMVDDGQLSAAEKKELVNTIENNLKEACANGQVKRVDTIKERLVAAQAIKPITRRVKHGNAIAKIRLKLYPLKALEEKQKNMSLTISDLQALGEKSELEEQIEALIKKSKGWFEDEEEFAAVVAAEEKEVKKVYEAELKKLATNKKSSGGKPSGTQKNIRGPNIYNSSGWATIGRKAPNGSKPSRNTAAGTKSAASGFAGLDLGDSD